MTLPQPSLFDYAQAQQRRDRGMLRASNAQERKAPGWADYAFEAIKIVAERQSEVHVDAVLAVFGAPPSHPNAWGSVWHRAIKQGLIEHTGTVRPSADKKKHAHNYPVYTSKIFKA